MFGIIAAAAGALLAGLFGFAATKPDSFRVQRSATIKASPDKIFPYLNDFHRWTAWSPWEKVDPNMKRTYSGVNSGRGAVYGWEGNNKAGAGRMEITESSPSSKVLIDLQFTKPFKAQNTSEFTLTPKGDATEVTWAVYGPMTFPSKVMCIFVSMDNLMGKDFEAGLANLKEAAEENAA
jgi:hypothetical protein